MTIKSYQETNEKGRAVHNYDRGNITQILGFIIILMAIVMPPVIDAYAINTYQVEARGTPQTNNRPWYGSRNHIGVVLPENVKNALNVSFWSGSFVSNSAGTPIEFSNVGYLVCKTGANQVPCTGTKSDNTKAEWFFEFQHNDGTITQVVGAAGSVCCNGNAYEFQMQTASAGSKTWQYYQGSVLLGSTPSATNSDRILDGDAPSGVDEVVQATDTSSQLGPVVFFPTIEYMNNARTWNTLSHATASYSHSGICPPWGFTVLAFQKTDIGSSQGCPAQGSQLW